MAITSKVAKLRAAKTQKAKERNRKARMAIKSGVLQKKSAVIARAPIATPTRDDTDESVKSMHDDSDALATPTDAVVERLFSMAVGLYRFEAEIDEEFDYTREEVEERFARYKTAVEAHLVRATRLGDHKKPDSNRIQLAILEEFKKLNRNLSVFLKAMLAAVSSRVPVVQRMLTAYRVTTRSTRTSTARTSLIPALSSSLVSKSVAPFASTLNRSSRRKW